MGRGGVRCRSCGADGSGAGCRLSRTPAESRESLVRPAGGPRPHSRKTTPPQPEDHAPTAGGPRPYSQRTTPPELAVKQKDEDEGEARRGAGGPQEVLVRSGGTTLSGPTSCAGGSNSHLSARTVIKYSARRITLHQRRLGAARHQSGASSRRQRSGCTNASQQPIGVGLRDLI